MKVPLELDVTRFVAKGRVEGEAPLDPPAKEEKAIEPKEEIVTALAPFGFSENACKRAAVQTKNAGTEVAMNWILAHMDDADLNAPLTTSASSADSGPAPDEVAIVQLQSMGFKREHAIKALAKTAQDPGRAATWLLSHMDELDKPSGDTPSTAATEQVSPGSGKYKLVSMITHMGKNSGSGHYICHADNSGYWVRFNDETVTKCKAQPPVDDGYIYVFKQQN